MMFNMLSFDHRFTRHMILFSSNIKHEDADCIRYRALIARLMRTAKFGFLITACVLAIIRPFYAAAQDFKDSLDAVTDVEGEQPWVIDADRLQYDEKKLQYVAEGNVVINKGNNTLRADYIRFDSRTKTAFARGNVSVASGDDILTGSSIELNLENQTGTLHGGYMYLRQNNFHVSGEKIEKLEGDTYVIENASVTTCDGDVPDWKIHGKNIKITLEGYGYVKGATMRARDVPFLYVPYFVFPAKTKRQSGLLIPELGASDRWGYYLNQPLFWAINESSDATFYYNFMSERGHKFGGQYRYYLSEASRGAWMMDYLNDRKIDDGTGDSSLKWGYADDDYLRPNKDRYWFRGGHYQPLPLGFFSRLEFDLVSDQDYLIEFKEGYSGYDDTEEYLRTTFGRQLDDYTDPVRLNRLDFHRIWSQLNLDIDFRWFDDVIQRRFSATNDTLQRLPFVGFAATKQRIFSSLFFVNLDSSYNYFYRKDGDRSQRLDIHPRFYLPLSLKNYFTLEPSVGLRETLWFFDPETSAGAQDDRFNRELYDFRVDLTSDISRNFNVGGPTIDRIKHTIKPQIAYNFIPKVDQTNLPQFDAIDRIAPLNLVTYSITNFFMARSPLTSVAQNGRAAPVPHQYRQIGRFKLAQSYDINEARRKNLLPGDKNQPFSPIIADLDLWLSRYILMDADAAWDIYDSRLQTGNIGMRLTDKRDNRLYTEYRFTRGETKTIKADLFLNITDAVATGLEYEKNLRSGQRLKAGASLLYRAQCWSLDVRYLDEPSNTKIQFTINLTGLGGVGGTF